MHTGKIYTYIYIYTLHRNDPIYMSDPKNTQDDCFDGEWSLSPSLPHTHAHNFQRSWIWKCFGARQILLLLLNIQCWSLMSPWHRSDATSSCMRVGLCLPPGQELWKWICKTNFADKNKRPKKKKKNTHTHKNFHNNCCCRYKIHVSQHRVQNVGHKIV